MAKKTKKYKIKDLVLNFVSLVTQGANPESDVLLVRSTEDALKSTDLPVTMFQELVRKIEPSQEQRDLLWKEFKRTWEWASDTEAFLVDFSVSIGNILRDYTPTEEEHVVPQEAEMAKKPTEVSEVTLEAPEAPAVDTSLALDALKEIERVREERAEFERKLQDVQAEREELRRKLEEHRSQEIERAIQSEADSLGDLHGLNRAEVVSLVRFMRDHADMKALVGKLVEANRALLADITAEKGVTVPAVSLEDETPELERAVKQLMTSDPTLSEARAVARVLAVKPHLYRK